MGSVAAVITEKDIYGQIEELRDQAKAHEDDWKDCLAAAEEAEQRKAEHLQRAQESMAKRSEVLKKISILTQRASGIPMKANFVERGTRKTAPMNLPPSGKKRGRPAGSRNKGNAGEEKSISHDSSLLQVIWNVLDRSPSTYLHYFKDYPRDAVGLKVSELKDVIEMEKKWSGKAGTLAEQLQAGVAVLRSEGKLARSEKDRRYFIVAGAELNGPPLEDDGTSMKEQPDGTYLRSDGTPFVDSRGKPVKKRQAKK